MNDAQWPQEGQYDKQQVELMGLDRLPAVGRKVEEDGIVNGEAQPNRDAQHLKSPHRPGTEVLDPRHHHDGEDQQRQHQHRGFPPGLRIDRLGTAVPAEDSRLQHHRVRSSADSRMGPVSGADDRWWASPARTDTSSPSDLASTSSPLGPIPTAVPEMSPDGVLQGHRPADGQTSTAILDHGRRRTVGSGQGGQRPVQCFEVVAEDDTTGVVRQLRGAEPADRGVQGDRSLGDGVRRSG